MIHGRQSTLAYWEVRQGSRVPMHEHIHEQLTLILEGRFRMFLGGEEFILGPMESCLIPSGVPHSGEALTECIILDTFTPVREEYR